MQPLHVRILYADSGLGLAIDAELLRQALVRLGCRVEITTTPPWSIQQTRRSHRIAGVKKRLPQRWISWLERQQVRLQAVGKSPVDLQIHLESPTVEYVGAAGRNWLIPNQEWLRPQHVGYLSLFERVLVKTQEGARQLQGLHPCIDYLGFSNPVAEALPAPNPDPERFRRFLHVAGKNRKKGTAAVVEAWRRHPEWPPLVLVYDDTTVFGTLPDNISHWQRPDRAQLQALQRQCGIVLAPSEVEGFGHILVESMAQQAIVITTDAAPMNEIVTPERGYPVAWAQQQSCHFGTRYAVTADALETCVEQLLNTPVETLLAQSVTAQRWVSSNHRQFLARLRQQIERLRRPAVSVLNRADSSRVSPTGSTAGQTEPLKPPRVSVIIPTYNCIQYLPAALESVVAQALEDYEIIVADDGSNDGTLQWLQAHRDIIPRLRWVQTQRAGPAGARNRAIAQARGEYIAFLDADDTWHPGKLQAQLAFHASNPNVVFSFTDYAQIDSQGCDLGQGFAAWEAFSQRAQGKQGYQKLPAAFTTLFVENPVSTSSVVVRRDRLLETALFDEHLPSAEDLDLWLQLAQRGAVAFSTATTVSYLVRPDSESSKFEQRMRALELIHARYLAAATLADPRSARRALARLAAARAQQARQRGGRSQALKAHLCAFWYTPSAIRLKALLVDCRSCLLLR